jgi:SAM-dependent methyltransferase
VTQTTSGIYSILSPAWAYSFYQNLVGAKQVRKQFVDQHVHAQRGDRVLDIGCGTGEILAVLPEVSYSGYDLSAAYIEKAKATSGGRGTFCVGDVGSMRAELNGQFDIVLAMGLLHHLDNDQALQLFRTAHEVLASGGRMVSIDPAFAAGQHVFAKWTIRRDRGRNVRTAPELLSLATRQFPDTKAVLRHDLLRIPYTHIILECSKRD